MFKIGDEVITRKGNFRGKVIAVNDKYIETDSGAKMAAENFVLWEEYESPLFQVLREEE